MNFTLKEWNTIRHCLECQIRRYEELEQEANPGGSMWGIWMRSIAETEATLNKLNSTEF